MVRMPPTVEPIEVGLVYHPGLPDAVVDVWARSVQCVTRVVCSRRFFRPEWIKTISPRVFCTYDMI